MIGNVYFIQALDRIKIGFTKDVAARLAQLQTANGATLRLVAVIPNAPRSLEKRLHAHFAQYRLRGEWFQFTGPIASLAYHVKNGARPMSEAEIDYYVKANCRKILTDEEADAQRAIGAACQEVRNAAKGRPWVEVRAEYLARGGLYAHAVQSYEKRYGKLIKRDAVH